MVEEYELTAVDVFEDHRDLLFGVAYRVLSSVVEAEDVVQESWLRWSRVDHDTIIDAKSFLIQVATRLSLDRLRRAKAQRESYVGPWLPEPLATAESLTEDAELAESVSMGLLVVLETLSPLERVVFVLREAFEFSFAEIAEALERSEPAVRQLAHRARAHVRSRRPRFRHDQGTRREVTERFRAACLGGDLAALFDVLAPDVTLWGDGGGMRGTPRVPVVGVEKVARMMAAISERGLDLLDAHLIDINGGPAAVFTSAGVPFAVLVLDLGPEDGKITNVWMVTNPDKLAAVG